MANYQNLKAAISAAIRTNGNQEITGQVLQDVLNSIVSVIGANYTFAGVATPATNPGTPDQNVIYLAMEGGTYTNFNGTVLPAGISLLMWNGSWTSETVMYGDGGVFDISVYKSSGGTLATFADLSAALDGGNNIPASARKGGMSVKFVQSSDNNYVQFRYMLPYENTTAGIAAFLNPVNWQGIETKPTAGSKNLVTSEGIFNEMNTFEENARASYDQEGWSSGYQPFALVANKKYKITLTLTNFTASDSSTVRVYLYESNTGTAQNIDITSLFGGASELIKGNPISIEFTPTFNVLSIITKTETSSYSPAEGCHVLAVAEEVYNKFDSLSEDINECKDDIDAIKEELESTIVVGTGEYSQTTRNTYGDMGANLVNGKENIIEITTSGFPVGWNFANIYLCRSASGSGRVEDILPLFDNPDINSTITARYTPSISDIRYLQLCFTSTFPGSSTCIVNVKVTRVQKNYVSSQKYEAEIGNISDLETANKSSVVAAINELNQDLDSITPVKVFGDILPSSFKTKLLMQSKDLLITCVGDSITGNVTGAIEEAEPEHCPPGCQYKHWVAQLQYYTSKVKPLNDRLDSQRNNVDFFTKVGTWEQVLSKFDDTTLVMDYATERSDCALTYMSGSSDASVSFTLGSSLEKCAIVYSREPDGCDAKIVIDGGNGKMLVSTDRENWVEANGYIHSQRTDLTNWQTLGNAPQQRHRRLYLKRVSGVTGDITITYQRDNTTSYDNAYMYCWGVQRWNGNTVFFDNIGRGGRRTNILVQNISDVFDRKPDLCIYEMPLINENSVYTLEQNKTQYEDYFTSSDARSYKSRSNNYTDVPLIVILASGRGAYFDAENNAIKYSTQVDTTPDTYHWFKEMFGWLMSQLSTYNQVSFVDLYDWLLSDALSTGKSINEKFSSDIAGSYTVDGTHLSALGAAKFNRFLSGIFI